MNQSEKRRKELLESTRALYRDGRIPPAIHPRYGNIYSDLYGEEAAPAGSFGLRVVLCCILFAAFVMMDYKDVEIAQVSSQMVIQTIESDSGLAEAWNDL